MLKGPLRLAGLLVFLGGLASCDPLATTSEATPARVARVIDGDTIVLDDDSRLRYSGIDTPERGSPGFDEATAANRALVEGRQIALESSGDDRFDRRLAFVSTRVGPDQIDVGEALLSKGHAWIYQRRASDLDGTRRRAYLSALEIAIDERRGLWKDQLMDLGPGPWAATTFRFHRVQCRHLAKSKSRKTGDLLSELKAGRSPCRTCTPLTLTAR